MIAFDAIQARGYERIGLVTLRNRNNEGVGPCNVKYRRYLIEAGFLMAQTEIDAKRRLPVLFLDIQNPGQHQADVEAWLKRYKPDAVMTDYSEMGKVLMKAGYRVPEDIALAANSVLDGNADAGIDQIPEEIGRVAVLVLNSLLHDNARGEPAVFRQVLVEGRWVDGASLPRRN